MSGDQFLLNQKEWRIIDQTKTHPSFTPLYSFAMDDTLCASVSEGVSPAVIRGWVHQNFVVLGNRDYRLARVQEGMQYLAQEGFEAIVRNSGGAAVVLDEGVFNLSLVLPAEGAFSAINAGYDAMVRLIRLLLQPYQATVDTGEIHGSYCPGDYDVSIGGRKFGGLAQRRRRGAVAVQAFFLVSGSGASRANMVRGFYERAAGAHDEGYPVVVSDRVASLEELLAVPLTVDALMASLPSILEKHGASLSFSQLLPDETPEFNRNIERMQERNPHLR
ncbi:biotin/lipoate A/B protein ligase family protein [Aneurinibacillus sp. Ricciae_BoGa-3]|uniref:lipoate--protein ligase family protein n=1 Tax=Aneurinibacillus sp. Ricciae_BoGa-3 TaxID=3022697 RepID=UPI002341783D|nr:biotin/lipoate A/B protein ligase family protein [Aneurinibacillus sp. Ricciae_BoGa-3]WCK53619.1 biotin/lipoate A/B protein ligase family protein [Aneurinibacillus sp. Ricciae_BoGa-3]